MSALHIKAIRRQECEAFMKFTDIKEGSTVRIKTLEQLKEQYRSDPYIVERLERKIEWDSAAVWFDEETYRYCGCEVVVTEIDEEDNTVHVQANDFKRFWVDSQWVIPIDNATNIDIKRANELI